MEMYCDPVERVKISPITTLSRSVMFVEYDKMLYFVIRDNYILIPILMDVFGFNKYKEISPIKFERIF